MEVARFGVIDLDLIGVEGLECMEVHVRDGCFLLSVTSMNMFGFFGVFGLVIITYLLEVNRAPFDLAEAESELVAGYSVEIGGFYFALYYLGEYFHLFFFSSIMSILFFGG